MKIVVITLFPEMFAPVISPLALTVAPITAAPVIKLPPVMFPVAATVVPSVIALAVTLPDPPSALLTTNESKLPKERRLEQIGRAHV